MECVIGKTGNNKGFYPGLMAETRLSSSTRDVDHLYFVFKENKTENVLSAYLAELLKNSPIVSEIYFSFLGKKESYENPIKLMNPRQPFINVSIEQRILSLFGTMVQKNKNLEYIYEQLKELLYEEDDEEEEEEKIEWSYTSFKSLCDFCSNPKFACMDVSLDVTSDGEACVQRTYKNSYVFILFKKRGKYSL